MNDKTVFRIILALTAVVFAVVVVLYQLPKSDSIPDLAKFLPMLNAIINGTCSVLLVTSFTAIKRKNIALHRKLKSLGVVTSMKSGGRSAQFESDDEDDE